MARKRLKWPALVFLAGLIVLSAACERTSIARINRDPGHFAGKDVTIAGKVISSFGLLGQGAFEVDDGTGQMWVISEGYGVPGQGAHVGVTGRIESGVNLGGRTFATVLRETKRRSGD